jgi:putative endonuclease
MPKLFCVYMLASKPNGTLYIGVTSNLVARRWQHPHHVMPGFTARYDVTRLVWYEVHETAESAITREKQLKSWRRAWKVQLLSEANPDWTDLAPRVLAEWAGGTVGRWRTPGTRRDRCRWTPTFPGSSPGTRMTAVLKALPRAIPGVIPANAGIHLACLARREDGFPRARE